MITNQQSGTTIDEVAPGIYRISTPVEIPALPGGFSFNQYLLVDDEPLLFHSGLRRMFPLVREAISVVMPTEKLRHVGFSHFEADESGALNDFLAIAPQSARCFAELDFASIRGSPTRTERSHSLSARLSEESTDARQAAVARQRRITFCSLGGQSSINGDWR